MKRNWLCNFIIAIVICFPFLLAPLESSHVLGYALGLASHPAVQTGTTPHCSHSASSGNAYIKQWKFASFNSKAEKCLSAEFCSFSGRISYVDDIFIDENQGFDVCCCTWLVLDTRMWCWHNEQLLERMLCGAVSIPCLGRLERFTYHAIPRGWFSAHTCQRSTRY